MLKALVYKELRETGWIALAALVAYIAFAANAAGYEVVPFLWNARTGDGLPFLNGPFWQSFCTVSVCLAIALGFAQTALESGRGTWLFLLHHPMSRRRIVAAKLAVGGGLYLACGAAAIAGFGLWISVPGNCPGPFRWWMTAAVWKMWAVVGLLYPAAFLSGIRPGRWFGTRLLPLAAAGLAALLLGTLPIWPLPAVPLLILVAGCLVVVIDYMAHVRDYS